MTPEEAKIAILDLFKEIQRQGIDVDITSDYGSDDRIELTTIPWSGWDNYATIKWADLHD